MIANLINSLKRALRGREKIGRRIPESSNFDQHVEKQLTAFVESVVNRILDEREKKAADDAEVRQTVADVHCYRCQRIFCPDSAYDTICGDCHSDVMSVDRS